MVVLHLDGETDAKALLGCYVCGDSAGDFRWQPGPLAQALAAGRWVLLEDVDGAPPDVMAALAPLLEGRPLLAGGGGAGGELAPAPGFRLFGSITHRGAGGGRELACASLWTRVQVAPPAEGELQLLLATLFPELAQLVPSMLASLAAARALCGAPGGVSPGRELTLRDVVRWAHRLRLLHSARLPPAGAPPAASAPLRELALLEGADLLGGMLAPGRGRDVLLRALSTAWQLPHERAAFYDTLHVPSVGLAPGGGALAVGRAVLPLRAAAPRGAPGFALTGAACRTLERLACAVAAGEPVLLVGETGCGKTAAVQALAAATGARLAVVNMSTQSDSADLLGGYKPRDAAALCLPLSAEFGALFADTFPREANAEFAARVVRPRAPPRGRPPARFVRKRDDDPVAPPPWRLRFCTGAQQRPY
jgi:midasin